MVSIGEMIALIEGTTSSKYSLYRNLNKNKLYAIACYAIQEGYTIPNGSRFIVNWREVVAEVDEIITRYFEKYEDPKDSNRKLA